MVQGTFTAEQLQAPKYNYLSDPEYISVLSELTTGRQHLIDLENQRYSADKINDDKQSILDKFTSDYAAMYANYTDPRKNTLNTIQNSYEEPSDPEYGSEVEATNELLRRQNAAARYALMTDEQLKDFVTESLSELASLPLYDQKLVIDELSKRHIDYDKSRLQQARQEQYKADPNWQQAFDELDGIKYCQPQGLNTMFGILAPEDDGSAILDFKSPTQVLQFSAEQAKGFSQALSYMRSLGSKRGKDLSQASVQQANEDVSSYLSNESSYQIADNDPRIKENGSHWNWAAFYLFLKERFGNIPEVANNPVYSDILNPNYDIEKTYNVMRQAYYTRLNNKQYLPVKVVDTHGKNPEEMSDSSIETLFGKLK